MKLTFEHTKEAFVKAIEMVGVDGFKRTSMFMTNDHRCSKVASEQQAA